MNKLNLLIHGPFMGNCYDRIFKMLSSIDHKKLISDIVIVCYEDDRKHFNDFIKSVSIPFTLKTIFVQDLVNPGFFNVNRQIHCVSQGLQQIKNNDLVLKLRNDQTVNLKKINKWILKSNIKENNKIITTNCFTRFDRPYHPSDMLLCANKKILLDYFSVDMMPETHMDCILKVTLMVEQSKNKLKYNPISPESYLFKEYINKKGWNILNNYSDSIKALKKYCFIVNSWDISLKWNKKRNPFLPEMSIILPYYLNNSIPFANGPVETARCIHRHNLNGSINLKDIFFIIFSRVIFVKHQLNKKKANSKKNKKQNIYKKLRSLIFLLLLKFAKNENLIIYLNNRV